ncbi:5-oxoprolinase [Ignicoccus pacificus DSM 13166]|uniref:5-oxoprolinase n=1 Tax=Ignicoccus pacificus DSM 13166 TaxID=940294 RepID=A0A977KA94_9CREN|nr:5-oxoprolinase [Ignicoccus pacificus DSM 13166]
MDNLKVGIIQRALSYIAEEMGIVLRNSSMSPNIRERLDMSCALLTDDGRIAAQAEHIPVHLGSLAWASKRILNAIEAKIGELGVGDVIIMNDPYLTGTHLNDVTVITKSPLGWVINKAHHVDVGGPVPGSLNPRARTLYEEGLVIEPTLIAKSWEVDEKVLNELASQVRVPKVFRSDVKAQIASLREGVRRINELLERYSKELILNSIDSFIESSRALYSKHLSEFEGIEGFGETILETPLKDVKIGVRLKIEDDLLKVDFSPTDDEVPLNVNAVEGIPYAATSFFLKALTVPEGPVDQGLYDSIDVKTREGSLLNPHYPAAVGAGNLETSQRALEALLIALASATDKAPSCGPGTMANVVISTKNKVYYETNGGGGSSTSREDGENAVQWGMTNTMNTPIEVLEQELPILFLQYRVRRGSGGYGRRKGGDGLIRSWKALERIKVTVMMSRTKYPSPGVKASPGKPGNVRIVKKQTEYLIGGYDTVELEPDDVFIIETPGGGGHV